MMRGQRRSPSMETTDPFIAGDIFTIEDPRDEVKKQVSWDGNHLSFSKLSSTAQGSYSLACMSTPDQTDDSGNSDSESDMGRSHQYHFVQLVYWHHPIQCCANSINMKLITRACTLFFATLNFLFTFWQLGPFCDRDSCITA